MPDKNQGWECRVPVAPKGGVVMRALTRRAACSLAAVAGAGVLTAAMATAAVAATGPVTSSEASPSGMQITNISCASPGNCTAVGIDNSHENLELMTETAGTWAPAVTATLPANSTGLYYQYYPPGSFGGQYPPWRVALALQDDGWILRNAIVWHKPNAMPESVRDRLSCRHELIFLLVKQPAYWFDLDPIRIPHTTQQPAGGDSQAVAGGTGARRPPQALASGRRPGGTTRPPKYGAHTRQVIGAQRYGSGRRHAAHPLGRNPGDVWSINTRPYRGPHFAAYPIDIPLRCIAAGSPGGTVLDPFCGTGTTGLAALQLGRRFTGIDLNPAFAALAAERLRHAAKDGSE